MDFPGRFDLGLNHLFDQFSSSKLPASSGIDFDGSTDLDFFSNVNFMDFDGDAGVAATAAPVHPPPAISSDPFKPALTSPLSVAGPHPSSQSQNVQMRPAFPYYHPSAPDFSDMTPSTPSYPIIPRLPQSAVSTSADPTRSSNPTTPSVVSLPGPGPTSALPNTPDDSKSFSLETQARATAEEDKRRRNTAASARFRVKKKLREQEMEKTAKEMTDKARIFEERVKQLEMENNWLRSLIVDRNGRVPKRVASSEPDSVTGVDSSSTRSSDSGSEEQSPDSSEPPPKRRAGPGDSSRRKRQSQSRSS